MKYIKTYEDYTLSDIKKYLVVKYHNARKDTYQYFIDIIHEKKGDNYVRFEMLYEYNDMTNKIEKVEGVSPTGTEFDNYSGKILFTSDDLDECMKYLNEYITANKYNL